MRVLNRLVEDGLTTLCPRTGSHIDSARMYGNEAEVGDAVRESGLPRNEVYVSKCSLHVARGSSRRLILMVCFNFAELVASKIQNEEHGYETTLAAVDDSLKTFGFDYIDFMLIHSAQSDKETRLATWRALIEAKAERKVRSIGVSN